MLGGECVVVREYVGGRVCGGKGVCCGESVWW
jgi:hypothetical protein